jgi:hypothetical protein
VKLGVTTSEPLSGLEPLQSPDAVQMDELTLVQLRVDELPLVIVNGFAVMVTSAPVLAKACRNVKPTLAAKTSVTITKPSKESFLATGVFIHKQYTAASASGK